MESAAILKKTCEVCVICEETKSTGVHLYTSFICLDCEKDIITTETSDPKYRYFVEKLRVINRPEQFM